MADEIRLRNIALSPNLPPPSAGILAIVGGGPSILKCVDQLRAWHGGIWAINGACMWCLENGIEATLFSGDPDPCLAELTADVQRAILAEHCDPSAFASLSRAHVEKIKGELPGPTSAVAASVVAMQAGYSGVVYFGCESSYPDTRQSRSHAYREEVPAGLVRVSCGGETYLTKLEYIPQAERLAEIIRTFPKQFAERSGGFLRALLAHGDYDVTHISGSMELTAT